MKKRLLIIPTLIVLVVGGLLLSKNVSAYWTAKDGKECFAVQYQNSYVNTGKAAEDGNVDHGRGEAYSTRMVCANVDANGKAKSLEKDSGFPSGTTHITDELGLKIYVQGNTVKTEYCTKTGYACTSGQAKKTGTYEIDKYTTFKALAQAVTNSAPISYGGGEKRGLEVNVTKETAKEAAEKEYEEGQAMNNGSVVGSDSVCYDESGHLGWIFCPLIEGIGNAMSQLYDNIVEPFLVIEPELFNGGGTYTAWDIFRNFANIMFVILFLVVIFSQLTGVGIDNYGIKRMLPKLIVAAVLINLSYVICELAVDLSNILGNSINLLFTNIAGQIDANAASPASCFSNLLSVVMAFLGLGAVAAGVGVTVAPLVGLGFAAIIPVLMGLLSAIVSVLFMFVILFVRKAVAILLVAVAPVAFVAYIMPNTKKFLFDKWLGIFKGILTVHPLAGALVGGGVLASSIIVAAAGNQAASGDADMGTFLLYIGALLLQVVPFFFLPRLFRSSLNAVGNLGNAIASRGARLGQRARGAVEGSERVQDWQNRQRENAALGKANRTLNRLQGRADRGDLSAGQRRRFARATNIKDAIEQQRSKENLIAAEIEYANKGQNQIMEDWNRAFNDNDSGRLDMLTNLLNKRYGASAASDIGKALESKDITGNSNHRASLNTLRQTMANNADFAGNMRNKSSDAFQMIGNGGMDKDGRLRNLDYFSSNNGICTSAKDWATQSSATLERAIRAKKLDEEMINNLLSSTAPDIQSGIQTDRDKVAVLRRGLELYSSGEIT